LFLRTGIFNYNNALGQLAKLATGSEYTTRF
jgi:hypothetical protein